MIILSNAFEVNIFNTHAIRHYPRFSLIYLFFFIFLMCSCQKPSKNLQKSSTLDLISKFDDSNVEAGKHTIKFYDPIDRNRHLGKGWKLKANRQEFPWPILKSHSASLYFDWPRKRERKVELKFVNIPNNFDYNSINLFLNDHEIFPLPLDSDPGSIIFFLPAVMQNIGKNTLVITHNSEYEVNPREIGLHSIEIARGAVLKTKISINNEIRPSLLMASPISILFKIPDKGKYLLSFDYGFVDMGKLHSSESQPTINFQILDSRDDIIQQENIDLIISNQNIRKWNNFSLRLKNIHTRNTKLKISYQSKDPNTAIKYLAVSDLKLMSLPRPIIKLDRRFSKPDIIIISTSYIGKNLLSSYGYPIGKTQFIDRFFLDLKTYSDVTSTCNTATGAIFSAFTGTNPIDHEMYNSNSTLEKSIQNIFQILTREEYQIYCYLDDQSENFSKQCSELSGFKKIVSFNNLTLHRQRLLKQLRIDLSRQESGFSPVLCWLHIDPMKNLSLTSANFFQVDDYDQKPWSIDEFNLSIDDQKRLKSISPDMDDLRKLRSSYDTCLYQIDQITQEFIRQFQDKRSNRDTLCLFFSCHGVLTDYQTNLLSNDSLASPVIDIPFFMGFSGELNNNTKGNIIDVSLSLSDIPALILDALSIQNISFHSFRGKIDKSMGKFFEHGFRKIVAYQENDWKMVYCYSEPYNRISISNLFSLKSNPGENLNVVGQHPQLRNKMQKNIKEYVKNSSRYPDINQGYLDEAKRILKDLNYLK